MSDSPFRDFCKCNQCWRAFFLISFICFFHLSCLQFNFDSLRFDFNAKMLLLFLDSSVCLFLQLSTRVLLLMISSLSD